MTFLDQYEGVIRLSVFAGIFLLMAIAEWAVPRKARTQTRQQRWTTNAALVVVDTLVLRLFFPLLAVAMALYASEQGWGLLAWLSLPVWLEIALAIILLDMLIYAQHVASHAFPVLWRFHKVHHVDRDIDVTTGARFHPIEIALSMGFKLLCVIVIGAPAMAVFLFEVLLNASAMFNHSNVKLPLSIDKWLRQLVVTPDMHRVHHSIIRTETDSNYGFFLSMWDHLFGTYRDQPKDGHDDMVIGLAEYQDERPASLLWCLRFPFLSPTKTPTPNGKHD